MEQFKKLCEEINEGFGALAILVSLSKQGNDDINIIIKEAENGR